MLEYKSTEYKLSNGVSGISFLFDDTRYELLSTFLSCDVSNFEEWIKADFDEVLSGKIKHREISGNVCGAEITPETTRIYDNLAEDGMGNWCEVETKELRELIDDWCRTLSEFRGRRG